MKNMKQILILLAIITIGIFGCSPDQPTEPQLGLSSGTADFSRVVAIGASYEAGVQDGYLTGENELNSYPAMIAEQMDLTVDTESADFVVPYVMPGAGTKYELNGFDEDGNPIIVATDVTGLPENINYSMPYNNLGVPGALLGEAFQTTTSENSATRNPMFDLILRNDPAMPETHTTQIEQAIALNPTFVIIGIYGNDALGAALSGEVIPGVMPVDPDFYAFSYQTVVDSLMSALPEVDLVGINVPDVTALPYVTTVPRSATVPMMGTVDMFIQTGDGEVRQTQDGDYVLLPAAEIIGDTSGNYGPEGVPVGLDANAPLPNSVVLDIDEVVEIRGVIHAYNDAIEQIAAQNNFPIFDVYEFLNEISEEGIEYGGVFLTDEFITGGLFSMDGVHANTLGYAVLANELINVINEYYDSTIPLLNMNEYY